MVGTPQGYETTVWIPETHTAEPARATTDAVVEIDLGGQSRLVATRLLRMAAAFALGADNRTEDGHDDAVFALACEAGNSLTDVVFNRPGGLGVVADRYPRKEVAFRDLVGMPGLYTGKVMVTSSVSEPKGWNDGENRCFVRASADSEEPLFFTKFGEVGPVGLIALRNALHLPFQSIGTAANFRAVPIAAPATS